MVSGSTAEPQQNRLAELLEELGGEVVLRHVPGRRVLDVGGRAPRLDGWCRARAARLETVPATALEAGEAPLLPWDDGTFDVVHCLRTISHLGTDEQSSLASARGLLAEMARVLVPGGTALVEIENPTSLRGVYQGIRHPMTVVDLSLTFTSEQGITRFDTLQRFLKLLPPELEYVEAHGLGVLPPLVHAFGGPLAGMFRRVEWLVRDLAPLRYFGGWLLIELRRLSPLSTSG